MKNFRFPDDVRKIAQVCLLNGHIVTYIEAEKIWTNYSEVMCAGWVNLPKSDLGIWLCIADQFAQTDNPIKAALSNETRCFTGIKIIVNEFLPDDCIMCSPKMYVRFKEINADKEFKSKD